MNRYASHEKPRVLRFKVARRESDCARLRVSKSNVSRVTGRSAKPYGNSLNSTFAVAIVAVA